MAWVKVKRLECTRTEDDAGRDEAYIKINDNQWGPWSLNNGDVMGLEHIIPPIEYTGSLAIELWDQDQGWLDKDDKLGTRHVSDYPPSLNQDKVLDYYGVGGSDYQLVVRVSSEKPV